MDQKTKHFVDLQEYMEPKSKRQTTYSIKIQIQTLNNTRPKKKKNYLGGCLGEYAANGR